jgi:hypothetical protein
MSTVRHRDRPIGGPRPFGERLIGAAALDVSVYEEVEADERATAQAALVVALAAVAAAIGASQAGPTEVLARLLTQLLGWLVWSGITYLIGDKLLGGKATYGELQRTIGFAQGPGLLSALRAVPGLSTPIEVMVALWKLIAAIVAIRQALDFSTGRALLTAVLGFAAYVGLALAITFLAGGPLPFAS